MILLWVFVFLQNGVNYTVFLAIYTIFKILKAIPHKVPTLFTPFTP